jgi:hypothetical protein
MIGKQQGAFCSRLCFPLSVPVCSLAIMPSHAGVTQLVECQPSKLNVAGSNPVTRFSLVVSFAATAGEDAS